MRSPPGAAQFHNAVALTRPPARSCRSGATGGEGLQNLMCATQAGAVLIGLAATATLGWSWLDPAIGRLLAGWAICEGIEAWRGEDCC